MICQECGKQSDHLIDFGRICINCSDKQLKTWGIDADKIPIYVYKKGKLSVLRKS